MNSSLIVLALFIAGIAAGMSGAVPGSLIPTELSEWLLYALVIQIGVGLGHGGNLRKLAEGFSFRALLLPLGTIAGTLIFTALAGECLGVWSIIDYLAVGSGMGYYSLSSVLIVDIKSHSIGVQAATQLGMLALLVNIIREMTALVLGPALAKLFGRYAPVAAAGVTSMDVTLPMIVQCTGQAMFPVAMMHGMVLEVSVPLLVTLFVGL